MSGAMNMKQNIGQILEVKLAYISTMVNKIMNDGANGKDLILSSSAPPPLGSKCPLTLKAKTKLGFCPIWKKNYYHEEITYLASVTRLGCLAVHEYYNICNASAYKLSNLLAAPFPKEDQRSMKKHPKRSPHVVLRVDGVLAMTRAIGDQSMKPFVSAVPEVTYTTRTNEDECLIIASDGLWDVMSTEEVGSMSFDLLQRERECNENAIHQLLGDQLMKPFVSTAPEVTYTTRTDEDECLIIASDGLWNVMSTEEVGSMPLVCFNVSGNATKMQ